MDNILALDGNRVLTVNEKACDGKVISRNLFTIVVKWRRPPVGITETMTVYHFVRCNKHGEDIFEDIISWGTKKIKERRANRGKTKKHFSQKH